jgi:hypothetical protein
MSEDLREVARKGRRVGGMFVMMIGAGIVLESAALWSGFAVGLIGVAIYASGFMAKTTGDVLAEKAREES